MVATAAYLLLYWVGSGSTTEYVPLPLTHRRMLMTALPCVLVIAALATDVLPWRRWVTTVVTALVVLPFIVTVAFDVARERPETAMSRVIRDDFAAPGNVVVVCPDFRCRTAIPFAFGFRLPPNLQLVNVVDFASAPDPAPATRVRVVVKPYARERLYGGTSIVQPIEALGLRPMYSHRRMRLYDAGDGTQLHAVLRPLLGR